MEVLEMKSKYLHCGVTLGVSILILVSVLFCADVADAKTKINIQAEKSRYYKKEGKYVIEGNPYVEYKDYLIWADLIEYFEDDDRANFVGNVVVIQNETKIHSERMEADLKDEAFVIDGNVDIYYVRKKKKDALKADDAADQAESNGDHDSTTVVGSDTDAKSVEVVSDESVEVGVTEELTETKDEKSKKDIIKIRAQHVEFTQVNDADHLVANTDVTMEVDDQTIHSTYLEYQGDRELVIARENVQVIGADEEELYTDDFTYWLEGEEEGFEAMGGVKLEFFMDSDEDEDVDTDTETNTDGGAIVDGKAGDETKGKSQDADQIEGIATEQEDTILTTSEEEEIE